jgi:hypothetical protein
MLQVLTADPSSGITVQSWKSGNWGSPFQPSVFENFTGYSAIAANQAGRIYGIVQGDEGPVIMEWAFEGNGTYSVVGNVPTSR